MKKFSIFLFDNCHAAAVVGVIDALVIANRLWKKAAGVSERLFAWEVVTPDGEPVNLAGGVSFAVDKPLSELEHTDVLFIPGITYASEQKLIDQVQAIAHRIRPTLQALADDGTAIAASCSGSFLLASAGLLQAREATTAWWLADLFSERFPEVRFAANAVVVEDANIFTSGPFQSHINLVLTLIEQQANAYLATACARIMLIDANRTTQSIHTMLQMHTEHTDALVLKAQNWMHANISEPSNVQKLADQLGVSKRNLSRRFKAATGSSPIQYFQELKIELAKRLLETSSISIEKIAEQVGYTDISTFRRLFAKQVAMTPRDYRSRYTCGE